MPDTFRRFDGSFDFPCSDCGQVGNVCICHTGPLVPTGTCGYFDPACWRAREEDEREGRPVRPLGVRVETFKTS